MLGDYSNLDFNTIIRRPECLVNQSSTGFRGPETEAREARVSSKATSAEIEKETNMENPTLEQMEAWRDQATERLSLFARSNAIEEPIGIGEECYQLGEDCYKPDRYDQFRWVTEDQFDSVLPPGIEHDRYIAMTNMTGFDDEIKEWSANWNDPGYWHDAAADALWSSNDGAYWTTRDEDPSDAVMARATAASQIALELDADNLIERTPENIGLLHDIVDTVHDMGPESDLGLDKNAADQLIWGNRVPILKSVGVHADTMPADLVDRVCAMDEHASAEQAKSFGKWWIDADTDPKLQNYELQGYGQPISHSDSCSGQPSYEPYVYGLSAPYSDLYVDQPTIPDPDPGIDPAASANPINPGIGM